MNSPWWRVGYMLSPSTRTGSKMKVRTSTATISATTSVPPHSISSCCQVFLTFSGFCWNTHQEGAYFFSQGSFWGCLFSVSASALTCSISDINNFLSFVMRRYITDQQENSLPGIICMGGIRRRR